MNICTSKGPRSDVLCTKKSGEIFQKLVSFRSCSEPTDTIFAYLGAVLLVIITIIIAIIIIIIIILLKTTIVTMRITKEFGENAGI